MAAIKATGKPLFRSKQKDQTLRVGRCNVQLVTAARIDCIGSVIAIHGQGWQTRVTVRVPGWCADGYHMDFSAPPEDFAVVMPKKRSK
jgi:hypothetical protein